MQCSVQIQFIYSDDKNISQLFSPSIKPVKSSFAHTLSAFRWRLCSSPLLRFFYFICVFVHLLFYEVVFAMFQVSSVVPSLLKPFLETQLHPARLRWIRPSCKIPLCCVAGESSNDNHSVSSEPCVIPICAVTITRYKHPLPTQRANDHVASDGFSHIPAATHICPNRSKLECALKLSSVGWR